MKKPVIINYKDTASLVDGAISYNGLVITAVQQMSKAYRDNRIYAYDANMVLRILLPVWYDAPLLLKQRITLNQIITNLCEKMDDKALANSLKNNRSELLRSFRTLAEIGVKWQDMPEKNEEEKVIKNLYKSFIQNPGSCVEAFWAETGKWENPTLFRRCLEERTMRVKNKGIGVPRAVYFQGFYYISALQSRLIQAFCGLDIPVYFLNSYDSNYEEAYRIWEDNSRFKGLETRFCGDEKNPSMMHIDQSPIYKFRDVFSMVSYLGKQDFNSMRIYAPMSEDIKELVDTFFDDREEKSRILAYPAGKYLFSLYSMWDADTAKIVIEPEKLKECFASGWAGRRYMSNSGLLQIYNKVAGYFSDCRLPEEWEDRISLLKGVMENIVPLFKPQDEVRGADRWHLMMSNPLHSFGCFNCSNDEIKLFADSIRQLINDCKILFEEKGQVDLAKHFNKIKKLLADKTKGCTLRLEEQKIVDVLNRRLSMQQDIVTECDNSHLADIMRFFLGGEMDEIIEDAEKLTSDTDIIRGISDIEAAPILYKDKKIILCCCDAISMPGKKKRFSWPLSADMMRGLDLSGETKRRCDDYLYFIESTRLSNRYLFHLIKKMENVEISWVEHQHDKDVNPSVYLLPYLDRVIEKNSLLLDNNVNVQYQPGPWNMELTDESTLPPLEEVGLDREMCPAGNWRLMYSFMLNQWPYYKSDFHMSFLLSGVIRAVADTMGISVAKAADHVFSLYPSMNEAEKKECMEFADKIDPEYKDRMLYDGASYSELRLYTEYFPAKTINALVKKLGMGQDSVITNNKTNCVFCPHGDYCLKKGGAADAE